MAASVSTSADTAVKSAPNNLQPGSKALLSVLILVLVVLFAYQRSASNKEQVLDQNFYRILYETGHGFSIRLQQLRRLHSYNKPAEVIRTQFPTYNEKNTSANKTTKPTQSIDSLHFELLQHELLLHQCQKTPAGAALLKDDTANVVALQANYIQCVGEKKQGYQSTQRATVSNEDVLPRPKGGFSLLLIVDDNGKVLASSGADNTISFSRFDHVIQALTEDTDFSLTNLFKAEPVKPQDNSEPIMPGVSRHVEINLSYGRYRVYLYPLPLADNFSKAGAAVKGLYMIGLLPEQSFAVQKHDIAGFKLMLLSVVSLLFLWTFLKVCLLPQHQAVPRWLISLCYLSGFAMFSLLVATLAVYFIHYTMLEQKTQAAFEHANHLNQNISAQFARAFNAAQSKTAFFQAFATAQHNCEPRNVTDCIQKEFSCTINQKESVLARQPGQCQIDSLAGKYSMLAHQIDKEYLSSIGESDPSAAWKFGVFQQSLALSQDPQNGLSSEATMVANSDYLLNTTVVNKNGNSNWPAVYFAEHNSALRPFSLAHRDYFKRVKTNSGWELQFEQNNPAKTISNSYVQRLFNIDSGTRGTTISMPFNAKPNTPLASAVLIADVFLPALNITEPPQQDFTYMVVDKITGAILYHSDNERSLIENVFFAGPEASTVKDFVQRQSQTKVLDDHYHGRAGRFVKHEMLMPDWQLLVFFPAHSLTLYSLVWFVILTLVPFISLVLIWLVITGSRLDTGTVKQLMYLPKGYRRRWLFLQLALLLSVICAACSYALVSTTFPCWKVLLWLMFGWLIIAGSSYAALSEKGRAVGVALANSSRIFVLLSLLCLPAVWYLSQVQVAPKLALQNYYQQWQQMDKARERKELMQAALYLYPNATTQRQLSVSELLHVTANLNDEADNNLAVSEAAQRQVEALPVLSSASGYAYFWQMIRSMLHDFADGDARSTTPPPASYVFWFLFALVLLLFLFVQYVERFLGARLCLSSAALCQLSRLVQISAENTPDSLSDKLLIKFKAVSLQGVDITAVLQVAAHQFQRELVQLLQLSRVLRKWQKDVLEMPSLKLHLELTSDGLLVIKLSDIEVSLERRIYRDHLLELLQELKALVLAGKLAGLTLESGFHSFQHLAIKDAFKTAERQDELDHAEYLIWSECLMDFKVVVPERFRPDVDPMLLNWEARWCPHVRMLLQHDGVAAPVKSDKDSKTVLQRLFRGIPDEGAILAVQSYMLCHADAFYRFKWENCTKDEQLALYNLALGHQLNPLNITLIQNLALNGLVRVHRGRLKLINNSFQQFVLNAEPQHKLQALVHEGEAGVWQQHRLTFAAIILTLLVAVAMTSGHSLHLIAVSVAGVLSTLVSVFSNASVLRSQFR